MSASPGGLFGTLSENGDRIANITITVFLLIAIVHAFSYALVYVVTLFNVIRHGEKSRLSPIGTRLTGFVFLLFYTAYNIVVYTLLLSIVNWKGLFVEFPWKGSVFQHKWSLFLYVEPVILILTTWFKIGCASDAWRRSPSRDEVMKLLRSRITDKGQGLPPVTIIMPIYNEPIEILMTAINSVVRLKYPKKRMHLVLAFDDDGVTPLYRAVVYCLTSGNPDPDFEALSTPDGLMSLGVSPRAQDYPLIGDVRYRGLTVTPCRFKHGGKRHAQMCAFRYLQGQYRRARTLPLLLFIDSDIELEKSALAHFVYDINRHTGIRREALTGLITCKTAGTYSFWKLLQDTEYIESQMLQRNTEDYLGSVSCLPGALTMVRFESLQSVANVYFEEMNASDNFDFNRTHLGEDRYLTHLLMEAKPQKYRIGFCPSARCKTEACEDFRTLMKQRRRWYLGTVTNEIYMITSPRLWKQFPSLNVLITLSALKNGPLFVYVFFTEAALGRAAWLTLGFAFLIFVPIWLFVTLYGFKIKRRKVMWSYPLVLLFLPILASTFQIYGMITFGVRSWGGPRHTAAKQLELVEDEKQKAVEDAAL